MADKEKFPVKTGIAKKRTCGCESKGNANVAHGTPIMKRQVHGRIQMNTTTNRTRSIKSRFLK